MKYETRGLEARADELRSAIQNERDAIAVLRAEWSLLNRPERLERIARKFLKLEPLPAQQMITMEELDAPRGKPMALNEPNPIEDLLRRQPPAMAH
jgi:hypothetical protein